MPILHRKLLSLLAGDDPTMIPTTRPRVTDRLPQRRCANSKCRCALARDNPERFCSPCLRRASDMPGAIADYLAG